MEEKGWVLVQIKAFSSWLNQTLASREMKVEDIKTDLSTGVVLINFFEILNDTKITSKWTPNPKNKIHYIQNLHLALTFLEKEMGVPNPGISAEEIVDTNLKLVLGLLWTLFRKYRIAVISEEDKSSEEGLLLWCKKITEGYDGVTIDKFSNSFSDGLAFLAMIHGFNPSKTGVVYENYSSSNAKDNLEAAFEFAEQEMGVPKLLDADEVASGEVDERSLVLYTSLFFHAYNSNVDAQANEAERERRKQEMEEQRLRKEKLKEENQRLTTRVEELREALKVVDLEKDELKEKDKFFEEKVDVMKQLLDQETEEKDELETTKAKLEAEYEELKKKLEISLSSQEKGEKELTEKLEEEQQKVSQLQEQHSALQSEVDDYKMEVEQLTKKLENESKGRKDKEKELDENNERSKVQLSGLGVLKRNLDQHIDDLGRWSKYLEYDKKTTLDFAADVQAPLQEEMENQTFQQQLDLLSAKLDEENEGMIKVLKQKQSELSGSSNSSTKKASSSSSSKKSDKKSSKKK